MPGCSTGPDAGGGLGHDGLLSARRVPAASAPARPGLGLRAGVHRRTSVEAALVDVLRPVSGAAEAVR